MVFCFFYNPLPWLSFMTILGRDQLGIFRETEKGHSRVMDCGL
jgi:hypothetical protein